MTINVGVGALIIEDGRVLLLKRSGYSKSAPGLWSRPGGRIEEGEKAADAVVREIREELGIDAQVLRFLDMSEHTEGEDHWIALGFLARRVKGEPKNMEPDKHDEIGWFRLDDLPELADFTRAGIDVYKKIS